MLDPVHKLVYLVDNGSIPAPFLQLTPYRDTYFLSPDDAGSLNGPFTIEVVTGENLTGVYTITMIDLANSQSGNYDWTASLGSAAWCTVSPSTGTLTLSAGV